MTTKFLFGLLLMVCLVGIVAADDPYAGYVPSSISGAQPLTVNFTDISYGTITSWQWNATDVNPTTHYNGGLPFTFSVVQNPSYTFYAGNYSIKLRTTNALGSNVTPETVFVNVSGSATTPVPIPIISGSPLNTSAGQTIQFNDSSLNTPTSWRWMYMPYPQTSPPQSTDFSTARNATWSALTGNWTIAMCATNVGGTSCNTTYNYVHIVPAPTALSANFTPQGDPYIYVGTGTVIAFNDTSTGSPTGWNWVIQNLSGTSHYSTPNASVLFEIPATVPSATFTIQLDVSRGSETSTITRYVTVTSAPSKPIARIQVQPPTTSELPEFDSSSSPDERILVRLDGYGNNMITLYDVSYNSPTSQVWNIEAGNGSTYTFYGSYVNQFYYAENTQSGNYSISLTACNDMGCDTLTLPDLIQVINLFPSPPISTITNITAPTAIQWSWEPPIIPSTPPTGYYDHVMIWKNGTFFENATTGTTWTGLAPNTTYTFSTKTVSSEGIVNATWVNSTARTSVPTWSWNATSTDYDTVWQCPIDVYYVSIVEVGGGGSGKGGSMSPLGSSPVNYYSGTAGFPGENLSYAKLAVIPGRYYRIHVGKYGANATYGTPSNAGGNTYTNITGAGIAKGGYGGTAKAVGDSTGGNGADGYGGLMRLAANGTNNTVYAYGIGGLGYGAPGGGGSADTSGLTLGGHGAGGYVEITVYGYTTGNVPNFEADTTTGSPGTLVHFKDLSTINQSEGLTYLWSFGDGTTSDANGDAQHVFSYLGSYTITLTLTSLSGSVSEKKEAYINIVDTSSGKINTLYPREVSFTLVDRYGRAIANLPVTATMTSSSVSNTNWLTSMFGLADESINSTVLYDTTDDGGQVVFPMIASGRYRLTFIDPSRGINEVREVHPDQSDYIYILSTSGTAKAPASSDYINITIRAVPSSATNPSLIYLVGNYTDTSSTTSEATFYVLFPNQTTVYSSRVTGNTLNMQYAVPNRAGLAYVWGVNATSTRFGKQEKMSGITLKGNGNNGLANNLVKTGCTNWGCT
jgi:PKD repeat protein